MNESICNISTVLTHSWSATITIGKLNTKEKEGRSGRGGQNLP
jgi:hypothetical protein